MVDIPKDLTAAKTEFDHPKAITMRSYNPVVKGHAGQIKKAVKLLLEAKRPMIYTGGGVILGNASAELAQLVRLLGYPCTNTLMGLGGYPASDRQFLGMLGMHGTYEANMAMHESDVIIAIGARFDDRVTGKLDLFCPYAKIIHIDVDPASISKTVRVDIPIVGDVKPVLEQMLELIKENPKKPNKKALELWWHQIGQWQAVNCLEFDRESPLIKPQYVIEQLISLNN